MNKSEALALVAENPISFKSLSDEFRRDTDVALKAVEQDGMLLEYFIHNYQNLGSNSRGSTDKVFAAAVRQNGLAIQFIDEILGGLTRFHIYALEQNGLAIQFCKLNGNFALCSRAVKQNGLAIQFIDGRNRRYDEILSIAVKQNGLALQFAPERYINNQSLLMEAVKQNVKILECPNIVIKNIDLALYAVKQNGLYLRLLKSDLRDNKAICLAAVLQNELAFEFVGDSMKEDPDILSASINPRIDRPIVNFADRIALKRKLVEQSPRFFLMKQIYDKIEKDPDSPIILDKKESTIKILDEEGLSYIIVGNMIHLSH